MGLETAAAGLSGATPYGAAAGALSAAAAAGNNSGTGDVSSGAITVGGLQIGGGLDWKMAAVIVAGLFVLLKVLK